MLALLELLAFSRLLLTAVSLDRGSGYQAVQIRQPPESKHEGLRGFSKTPFLCGAYLGIVNYGDDSG